MILFKPSDELVSIFMQGQTAYAMKPCRDLLCGVAEHTINEFALDAALLDTERSFAIINADHDFIPEIIEGMSILLGNRCTVSLLDKMAREIFVSVLRKGSVHITYGILFAYGQYIQLDPDKSLAPVKIRVPPTLPILDMRLKLIALA